MIADAIVFLQNRLNQHFKSFSLDPGSGTDEDRVVFPDGDQKSDSVSFKTDSINLILFRIEKEGALSAADPFVRLASDGTVHKVKRQISLNLYVLFVAKFKDYAQGLSHLSQVIGYFQSNNGFDRQSAPELGEGIAELALDLVSMTVQEENELWGLFRTFYLPSVAYRIRTIVISDETAMLSAPPVSTLGRRIE